MTAREGPSADTAAHVRARLRSSAPAPEGPPPAAALPAKLRPPRPACPSSSGARCSTRSTAPTQPLVRPVRSGRLRQDDALRQWAEADPRPSAWVQLDAADDDPVVLLPTWRWRSESVTDVDPAVRASLSLGGAAGARARPAAAGRGAGGGASRSCSSSTTRTCCGATSAGTSSPSSCAACPGARSWRWAAQRSPLPLARLRAAGELAEFRACRAGARPGGGRRARAPARLRGRQKTVDAAARRHGGVGDRPAARVPGRRRPAACGVAARRSAASRREIAAYLTVRGRSTRQPADVQEFLLRTSVLRELTPAPVQAASPGATTPGSSSPASPREELFVVPLGDDGSPLPLPPPLRRDAAGGAGAAPPRDAGRAAPRRSAAWYADARRPGRGGAAPARGGRGRRRRRRRRRLLAGDVEPRPGRDGAALARRRSPTARSSPTRRSRSRPAGCTRRSTPASSASAGARRPAARRMDDAPSPGRRRVAALARRRCCAPPSAPDGVRAHARGRRAGGPAGGLPGHQLVRRRPGRRSAWRAGCRGRPSAPCTRWPSARVRAPCCNPSAELAALGYLALDRRRRGRVGRRPRSTRRARPRASRSSASARTAAACPCCSPA